jgi:hypothetical protein
LLFYCNGIAQPKQPFSEVSFIHLLTSDADIAGLMKKGLNSADEVIGPKIYSNALKRELTQMTAPICHHN